MTKLLCENQIAGLHQHAEYCYDENYNLTCGYADFVLHTHTAECYSEDGTQICPLEENKGYKHSAGCYDENGSLICGQAESWGVHQHTAECYKYEDGTMSDVPICGKLEVTEHVHNEGCFPKEEKVLICGKEEHVHTETCYADDEKSGDVTETEPAADDEKVTDEVAAAESTVGTERVTETSVIQETETSCCTVTKNEAEGTIRKMKAAQTGSVLSAIDGEVTAQGTGIEFGSYITGTDVSKLVNGEWEKTETVKDGDQIKVSIEYSLPKNSVDTENRTIYYQLPKGIRLNQEESGIVYQDDKPVGTYTIGIDGLIQINFNEDFADGDAFTGNIQFQGTISADEAGESGKIEFGGAGGSITIEQEEEQHDLSVVKNGTLSGENEDGTKKVGYEIIASTNNGTEGLVTIKDEFKNGNGASGTYDEDSFKIYKIKADGTSEEVIGYVPTFGINGSNPTFEIKDLPKLEAGEQYRVAYSVDVAVTSEDGYAKALNSGGASSGGDDKWVWKDVEVSKPMIEKYGWFDRETGLITWTIVLNQDKKDISGYQLSDAMPEGIEIKGDVVITGSNGGNVATIPVSEIKDNKIVYEFSEGSNDTYTITYKTTAPEENGKVTNEADLDKDDKHYGDGGDVWVNHRDYGVTKSYKSEETQDGKTCYTWQSDITIPEGALKEFEYTDTIHNAFDKDDSSDVKGNDTHYGIASELDKAIKASLKFITADGKELSYENEYVEYVITYYDANDSVVSATDSTTLVKKFLVQVKPKAGKEIEGKKLSFSYSTIVDYDQISPGDTWVFKNSGAVGEHNSEAKNEHKQEKPLEKQGGVENPDGSISYVTDDTKIDYDAQNGILYYRLLLNTQPGSNGEIIVTDTLPAGATLVDGSVEGWFYVNDWDWKKQQIEWWDTNGSHVYDFSTNGKPNVFSEQQEDGTTEITVKIPAGYNSNFGGQTNGNIIAITYQISVKDDPLWDDMGNESYIYTNRAEWNDDSSEQNTEVDREVEEVRKIASQLKDENGNPTNVVEYTIHVNPAGKDLDPNADMLTLTDVMTLPEGIGAYLDLQNTKLYLYDGTKEDCIGEVIDTTRYQLVYDEQTNQITVQLPDGLACVLRYRYVFDIGNKQSPTIKNKVQLGSEWSDENDKELEDTSSSAIVRKGKLTIYKVDGKDYTKWLPGAEFQLDKWNNEIQEWEKIRLPAANDEGYYVTDENGELSFEGSSQDELLSLETLYRLTEVKAPEGYAKSDETYCFVLMAKDGTEDSTIATMKKELFDSAGVNTDDVRFFDNNKEVSIFVPNDYTRVGVKKVWVDDDGKEIDPAASEIKVQLYRSTKKPVMCNVTFTAKDAWNGKITFPVQIVPKNTKVVVVLKNTNANFCNLIKIQKDGVDFGTAAANSTGGIDISTGIITEDCTIDIVTGEESGQGPWIPNTDQCDFVIEPPKDFDATTEKYGEEVTLGVSNGWSHEWLNLEKYDDAGNQYYYYIEEISINGSDSWEIIYMNNDGIQEGEIVVTNKVKKSYDFELPETGGSGTTVFTLSGILLMAAAAIRYKLNKIRRRRRERRQIR